MARILKKESVEGLRLRGVYAAVDNLTQRLAREAAKEVVRELVLISPQYTRDFAKNWVVVPGNVVIPANTPRSEPRPSERLASLTIDPPDVPTLNKTGERQYSIGNTMVYRDIAMDLKPGRVENAKTISAPQDWYIGYLRSPNGLRRAIEKATNKKVVEEAFVAPRGRTFIGPVGRFV